jgi:hypothetical protein
MGGMNASITGWTGWSGGWVWGCWRVTCAILPRLRGANIPIRSRIVRPKKTQHYTSICWDYVGCLGLWWLLGTSVQEIGILHAIEHASLPKHVRCEYHPHRPFCSFSLARCLFSRRRGSIREVCVHFDQATNLFQLSRAPRTFFALAQTIDDFPGARNTCRHDQRKILACFEQIVWHDAQSLSLSLLAWGEPPTELVCMAQ